MNVLLTEIYILQRVGLAGLPPGFADGFRLGHCRWHRQCQGQGTVSRKDLDHSLDVEQLVQLIKNEIKINNSQTNRLDFTHTTLNIFDCF